MPVRDQDFAEIKRIIEHLEEVLITGNGEPALREQVRSVVKWIEENKAIPAMTLHNSHWIQNVNRFGWIVAGSLVGLFFTTACGIIGGVMILLWQNNLFQP
jgi:hypothetical protein